MTKSEKDYALKRVRDICRDKESAIKEKYPKTNKRLTNKEKVALIKSGKATLKKDIDYAPYRLEINDIFEWPVNNKIEKTLAQMNKEISSLNKHAIKVKDEIMLGDNARALKLIREFEKF